MYEVSFLPQAATVTAALSTANTAVRVALSAWPDPKTGGVRVVLDTPTIAFMVWGDDTVTATMAGLPLLPGSVEAFSLPLSATHVSIICPGSIGNAYVTQGRGA